MSSQIPSASSSRPLGGHGSLECGVECLACTVADEICLFDALTAVVLREINQLLTGLNRPSVLSRV
jgi:hypothetical protein